jgi:hypothetical protein
VLGSEEGDEMAVDLDVRRWQRKAGLPQQRQEVALIHTDVSQSAPTLRLLSEAVDDRSKDTVEIRYERRRSTVVAAGTLACPRCDAPVSPGGRIALSADLACPFCAHSGRTRDFLSLGAPTRAAHVVVRIS